MVSFQGSSLDIWCIFTKFIFEVRPLLFLSLTHRLYHEQAPRMWLWYVLCPGPCPYNEYWVARTGELICQHCRYLSRPSYAHTSEDNISYHLSLPSSRHVCALGLGLEGSIEFIKNSSGIVSSRITEMSLVQLQYEEYRRVMQTIGCGQLDNGNIKILGWTLLRLHFWTAIKPGAYPEDTRIDPKERMPRPMQQT